MESGGTSSVQPDLGHMVRIRPANVGHTHRMHSTNNNPERDSQSPPRSFRNPELIAATFSNGPFYSERYSRCKETFCYLKVDGSDELATDYQDRDDMEEAVRNALAAQDVGALIGAGTGLRYSYMELALTDVDRGIAAIRRAMREGNVPRRSWILFNDAHLAAEWVGIYDDSPAPPMDKVEL